MRSHSSHSRTPTPGFSSIWDQHGLAPAHTETWARGPELRGAWLERVPGWERDHVAALQELRSRLNWIGECSIQYGRWVEIRRLLADVPLRTCTPAIRRMVALLGGRYNAVFRNVRCELYRDGQDSAPFNSAEPAGPCPTARDDPSAVPIVARVFLGGPRELQLRQPGSDHVCRIDLEPGDLLATGGSRSRPFVHRVPKVPRGHACLVVTLTGHTQG